jgi:alkylation response protein AidB-like acyl-CoA dehydrogenase
VTDPHTTATAAADAAAASEAAWRGYIRSWLADHQLPVPPPGAPVADLVAFDRQWLRELHCGGLAAPQWPRWAGGLEVPPSHEIALHQEFLQAGARWPDTFYTALNHAGRAVIVHGTPEQRRRHIGEILNGATVWCQAFSEPDAGSDLASLRTFAERHGDVYVVRGQKVWSSSAHIADRAILLARTSRDRPRHRGISFFLLDMRSPGVTVRPIRQMTGGGEFCEIFLDDVEVPVEDRLGDENAGWAVVHTVLSAERGPGFLRFVVTLNHLVEALLAGAAHADRWPAGRPLDDGARRAKLASLLADADVLTIVLERVLRELATTGTLNPASSVVKLMFAELHRKITEVAVDLEGLPGQLAAPNGAAATLGEIPAAWMQHHLRSWTYLLGGGTSEIQRNHIAEGVLGLPREPRNAASPVPPTSPDPSHRER